jgi:hypothetical protein
MLFSDSSMSLRVLNKICSYAAIFGKIKSNTHSDTD